MWHIGCIILIEVINLKQCNLCLKTKPVDHFRKQGNSIRPTCKQCINTYSRAERTLYKKIKAGKANEAEVAEYNALISYYTKIKHEYFNIEPSVNPEAHTVPYEEYRLKQKRYNAIPKFFKELI